MRPECAGATADVEDGPAESMDDFSEMPAGTPSLRARPFCAYDSFEARRLFGTRGHGSARFALPLCGIKVQAADCARPNSRPPFPDLLVNISIRECPLVVF